MTASNTHPQIDDLVRFNGQIRNVTGPKAIVQYRFTIDDGSDTGWLDVNSGETNFWTWHIFSQPGTYHVQFLQRLQDGTVTGGNNRCALTIYVESKKITTPPIIPVCGSLPPVFIVSVVENGRRLALTGLSEDGAPIEVQVKGPTDADFVTNGNTTADAYGTWAYTTTALGRGWDIHDPCSQLRGGF